MWVIKKCLKLFLDLMLSIRRRGFGRVDHNFRRLDTLMDFLQHLRKQNPLSIYLQLTAKKVGVDFQTSPLKGALYADVNAELSSGLELWGKDLASVKGFFLLVDTLSSNCIERMKIMKR